MRGRHITTAVTLLVLVGILVVGAFVGVRSLLAPVGGGTDDEAAPACSTTAVRKGERIASTQVTVSVFNAGTKAGLADETLTDLRSRGFRKGDVGNAPSGSRIKIAQVWTTRRRDAAARLVALQFGPSVRVRVKDDDLGPGVDVLVGDGFDGLASAKRAVVVKNSQSVCLKSGITSAQ